MGRSRKMSVAIYPGSFDPITNGHKDIIDRASRAFDRVIVSVLENPRKLPLFSIDERVEMLNIVSQNYANVEVDSFRGLLIEYARKKNASIIVKGLRAISDFEFEFQMALINRKLDSRLETMFMMTNSRYSYLSSSIVKEVGLYGGDICELVPREVYNIIMRRIREVRDGETNGGM
jgi:pantetheine-phosphate adenylyltransferase